MLQDGQSGDFFSFFMCALQIVQRYDIILIQEVRDGDLSAVLDGVGSSSSLRPQRVKEPPISFSNNHSKQLD